MDFFVNELSLHGQFESVSSFLPALKQLLQCRETVVRYTYRIYCLRAIGQQPVTSNFNFRQSVMQIPNRDIVRLVLAWVDKHGPFLDEVWERNPSEWFEHAGMVVTDYSLGEAAWRKLHEVDITLLSFTPSNFIKNPLSVTWKSDDTNQTEYDIYNFWELSDLDQHCISCRTPIVSWEEMLIRLQSDYSELTFLESILSTLGSEPFSPIVAKHVEQILAIINKLRTCFDEQGTMTAEGHILLQEYFHGDRALFSDESDTNKVRFRQEMTFKLPNEGMIFCSFHGKIKHRQFRIHFSWPIRRMEPIYIAYIGPKITKS